MGGVGRAGGWRAVALALTPEPTVPVHCPRPPLPACLPAPADLVELLQASAAPLVQVLAAEMERGQERRGSQTVGARFRDQLRDLMQRLDA